MPYSVIRVGSFKAEPTLIIPIQGIMYIHMVLQPFLFRILCGRRELALFGPDADMEVLFLLFWFACLH